MNNRKHAWTIFGTTTVCCLGLLVILAIGCEKKAEKQAPAAAKQEKTATELPSDRGDDAKIPASTTAFANVRCPMMGTKIDPGSVPEKLTRKWKGQKVAFCCAGCPVAWDKLSDTDKDANLAKVLKK